MKQERVFPKYLNLTILLFSIVTIILMAVLHFGVEGTTAWKFLLGENHQILQTEFIKTSCTNFSFFGYAFIYILYAMLFLSLIDIFLCLIMFIPSIRRNYFMALLYKTFLIFFGAFQLLCYLFTLTFMVIYFVSVGRAGVSFVDFFTSLQTAKPIFWISISMFFLTVIISMTKLMAYRNFKRPV